MNGINNIMNDTVGDKKGHDIVNDIEQFCVSQAAYFLLLSFKQYPEGNSSVKGTNLSLVRMTQLIETNSVIYTEVLSGHCRQWSVAAAEMDKNTQKIIANPHYWIFTLLVTSVLPNCFKIPPKPSKKTPQ